MATTDKDILRNCLPEKYDRIDQEMQRNLRESTDFKGATLPGFLWHEIGSEATGAIGAAMDENVFAIFARGWCKVLEVRKQAAKSLKQAEPIVCCLSQHKANATVKTTVEVRIDGMGAHRVPFALDLTAVFEPVRLTLRNGAIVSIGSGQCGITAVLKCAGQPVHPPKETPKVVLGSPLVLKTPLQVVPAQLDAA